MSLQKYLFRFGYNFPAQYLANMKHGWDDEDSKAVFILAGSENEALNWGREVAEAFVARLYAQEPETEPMSWKEGEYAHWIENDPQGEGGFKPEHLLNIPILKVGELLP